MLIGRGGQPREAARHSKSLPAIAPTASATATVLRLAAGTGVGARLSGAGIDIRFRGRFDDYFLSPFHDSSIRRKSNAMRLKSTAHTGATYQLFPNYTTPPT